METVDRRLGSDILNEGDGRFKDVEGGRMRHRRAATTRYWQRKGALAGKKNFYGRADGI
jgi:hypothetical protein